MLKGSDIKRIIAAFLVTLAAAFLSLGGEAFADVNDFTITNLSADYYLTRDDPQGQMRVVERLDVDFETNNHGILRALPESYKNLPLNIRVNRISSDSGAPTQYTTYEQNGNKVLKIGDPDRTVTGMQEYTIDYTLQNVVTFYADHDELYWNTNGLQWMQPFERITATIHLPSGLSLGPHAPVCYTGPEGSRDQSCETSVQGDTVSVRSNVTIWDRETMSFVIGFQKGYFQPPTLWDYARGYVVPAIQFLVPFMLIGGAGFIWWLKRGRDAKGTGVIIPQYDAPDGMTPLEVGTLVDFKVDNRDLTATIIDLAVRKYIRIIENDDKKLLVLNHKSYSLELLNKDWTGLRPWEQELLGGLFGNTGATTTVNLSAMANKLQLEVKNVRRLVEQTLVDGGYFNKNPMKYVGLTASSALIVGVVFILQAPISWQGPVFWGVITGAVALGIFYHLLPSRTMKGVAANEHAKGLKLYLSVAEKDRLKMLQSPDAPYIARTNAPAQTVELFEKLLPYAIALQVEKQWAKKFENIYASPPDWYVGNYAAFNAGYLVGSLGSGFNSAMVSSFTPPHSASGSGFGGGFSGGGGGGGGGGGW